MSKFGRFAVAEAPSALARLHWHHPEKITLREVDHEPKVSVLDQEDLLAQGIRCSELISGAEDVDALGSCTAQTVTEQLSNILPTAEFLKVTGAQSYEDTVGAEKFAIRFYHGCTDQTGDPSSEWPPTDCGSSGPYLYQYARAQGLIKSEKIAVPGNAESIVSLMQSGALLVGMPWLKGWMQPVGPDNFLDQDGSAVVLREQIDQGVAGGHEITFSAIEKLTLDRMGRVDPFNTVIRFRNHWDSSWADHGSARFHLSTIVMLGSAVDLRQFIA